MPDDLPFPDDLVPSFRQAAKDLAPKLCQLTAILLQCMSLALGKYI